MPPLRAQGNIVSRRRHELLAAARGNQTGLGNGPPPDLSLHSPIPFMTHWLLSVCWQPDNELFMALTSVNVRSLLAAVVSFLIVLAATPWGIRWLSADPLKTDSPRLAELSQTKQTTPGMGGLFLIGALAAAVGLLADLSACAVQQSLVLLTGMMLLGLGDDLLKRRASRRGLSARGKLAGQIAVATVVAIMLYHEQSASSQGVWRELPGIGPIDIGMCLVPWAVVMMVGMSNAVNLTDGLDGLAGGCVLVASAALLIVVDSSEALVILGGLIGALMGFLRFNVHPARVFMGDTGSLPLGGLLGLLAVGAGREFFVLGTCGVLVAETASVVLQVGSYRLRGKRIFLCAPLHHHFQFAGWSERKVVARFWTAAGLCAALALAALFWTERRTQPSLGASEPYQPLARSEQAFP